MGSATNEFNGSTSIFYNNIINTLFISDRLNNRIQYFEETMAHSGAYPQDGQTAAGDPYGSAGSTNTLLNLASAVVFLPNGTFLVADEGNQRIMQYDEIG